MKSALRSVSAVIAGFIANGVAEAVLARLIRASSLVSHPAFVPGSTPVPMPADFFAVMIVRNLLSGLVAGIVIFKLAARAPVAHAGALALLLAIFGSIMLLARGDLPSAVIAQDAGLITASAVGAVLAAAILKARRP